MNVVFAIPVAADDIGRANRTFKLWADQGYKTAALVDGNDAPNCDVVVQHSPYCGWAWAVNHLAEVLAGFNWLVTGGADIFPDPSRTADQVAAECLDHFGGTFGVMQPVGDPYGALETQTACVSPWLGREWRERHPMHEGYYHFWADAELAQVAGAAKRLWWHHGITQRHDHWARTGAPCPGHLAKAQERHAKDWELFERRKAAGFP